MTRSRAALLPIALLAACSASSGETVVSTSDLVANQPAVLTCTKLTVTTGRTGGQQVSALATKDLSGTTDSWNKYVELQPASAGFVGTCTFPLPAGMSASSIASLALRVNYRGPAKDAQVWTFEEVTSSGGAARIGDNAFAQDWVWSGATMTFPGAPADAVSNGAIQVTVRTATNVDASDIDELVVLATTGAVPASDAGAATGDSGGTGSDAGSTATDSGTTGSDAGSTTPPGGVKPPPAGKIVWDWQIGASSDSAIAAPSGARLIDVDGFNTSAQEVAALKAQGLYTVCYIDAGSWEPNRPDSSRYPDYLKIYYDSQWGEWFLDVTDVFKPNSVLAQLLTARLQMCKDKGFDALEPDNLQNDENAGGKITTQQQLDFNGWIADAAHKVGLAVFQKNGPDKVLQKNSAGVMMVDKFDGILNEQCQEFSECAPLAEYVKRGKLALDVEYKSGLSLDCAQSNSLNINEIKKDLLLVGAKDTGYVLQSCP